jgi:hypothetical protein
MSASWTAYVFAPFYVLLPKRWRQGERHGPTTYLARAALISGVGEAALALIALCIWYMLFLGFVGNRYADYAQTAPRVSSQEWQLIGEAGLFAFALSPLTWVFIYFGLEGIIRACAALTSGDVVGTLPLYLVDFVWQKTNRKKLAPELPLVPDEITTGGGTCDIQIASCRKRDGWAYPFTLRYAGAYFQVIEHKCVAAGPRPYLYSLRRLPIGEVARGLRDYDPADVLRPVHRVQM